MRFLVFPIILVASITATAAQTQYSIPSWPDGLQTIPCDAFKKNRDGSWTQTGTIIVETGNLRLTRNTFKNGIESVILDQRCDKQNI
jgi:hypothetical protein